MNPDEHLARAPYFNPRVRGLILAFALLSLGGLLLHVRIHPPAEAALNWLGTLVPLANLVLLPFLFNRPATAPWAVLATWATALVGTALMTYFSVTHWKDSLALSDLILKSTFPDILVLWTKVPLAHAILERLAGDLPPQQRGCAP